MLGQRWREEVVSWAFRELVKRSHAEYKDSGEQHDCSGIISLFSARSNQVMATILECNDSRDGAQLSCSLV